MKTEDTIKILMVRAGIPDKTALAKAADLSRPTVDAVMDGGGSVDSAKKVAAALGCTVGDLCLDGVDL